MSENCNSKMPESKIPLTGTRTTLSPEIQQFLHDHPTLHLGGEGDFHDERRHHQEVLASTLCPKIMYIQLVV